MGIALTQNLLAELYQTSIPNIVQHIRNILREGEVDPSATTKDYLVVRREGDRQVRRTVKHYSLETILAVGYRVRSERGTVFRQLLALHGVVSVSDAALAQCQAGQI